MKSITDWLTRRRPESPTIADFPRAVGQRLRRQRMAFEWRQTDLAERAGVSVQTVKALEKGEAISYESLLRLLLAFGHGSDFLQMLEAPNFPHLRAHDNFLALPNASAHGVASKRVRPRTQGAT
jgi:DNA-binding XRE family transcriptional regulator